MLSYLVLHRMGFTKLPVFPPGLVVFYTTVSPVSRTRDSLLSVALSVPRDRSTGTPPVRRHPVLWCSDFPPRPPAGRQGNHTTGSDIK